MSQTPFNSARVEVTLSCEHTRFYYPAPFDGDPVYCPTCATYVHVMSGGGARSVRLRVKCRQCRYTRAEPQDIGALKTRGQTHALRNEHVVDLKRGGTVLDTLTPALTWENDEQTVTHTGVPIQGVKPSASI